MAKIDKNEVEKTKGTGLGEEREDNNIDVGNLSNYAAPSPESPDKTIERSRKIHYPSNSEEFNEKAEINGIIYKDILNKNFPSAVCQHCKKVTDIRFSSDFRRLISRNRTLKEINKTLREDWYRWMNAKNGQIEAMHKMTAELIELIPEEQRANSKKITREIRDEMKHIERKFKDMRKVYKSGDFNNNNMFPGDPKGSPDESFFKDTAVFIDSAFLEKLNKHFGKGLYLKFDRISFSIELAKKQGLNCKAIFYYTAPPFQGEKPTKEEKKKREGYDRFINKLKEKGAIIREGRCQMLKTEGSFVYKQKAVDILLAMDLMSVSWKYPKIKRIILVSSDSDFVPVVRNLGEKGVKTILYSYYEKIRDTPFSISNHLVKSVHKYVLLTKEDFKNAPLTKEKGAENEREK